MVAALLSFLDRQIIALLVEPIKEDLNVDDVRISLLQGLAFSLFYAVMALPFGHLADRYNRHHIIIFALITWGSATIACGLAGSYGDLFAARIFVGIGEAALMPAAYSLISTLFPPERRARAFSLFAASGIVGVACSLFLGGAIVEFAGLRQNTVLPLIGSISTWQLVFVVAGLPAPILAMVFLISREPPRATADNTYTGADIVDLVRFVRCNRVPVGVVFCSFGLAVLAGYGTLAWMAAAYARIHESSIADSGFISGIILLVSGFGGVLIGSVFGDLWTIRRRVGGKLMIAVVAGLPASVLLSLWWLTDNLVLGFVLAVIGSSLSFAIGGLGPAALNDMVPNELRGKMSALYLLMVALIGYAGGPFVVALLNEHVFQRGDGIRYSLVVVNVAFVGGALAAWLGRKAYWRLVLMQMESV